MRNNKGVASILIVLIIVGVLALGGGTYYFLVKKAPKSVVCTQEAKICPDGSAVSRIGPNCEFAECPTVKTGETADWKIYKSAQMGFEIKYRPDLEVSNESILSTGTEVDFYKVSQVAGKEVNDIIMSIRVGVHYSQELMREYTLDEWISANFLPLKEGESKKTIIFGVDNYEGIRVEAYKSVGVIRLIPHVFIQKDRNIYEITGNVPSLTTEFPKDYDPKEIFDQMLSTFRFLE